jgi:hypothetical protein
MYADSLQRRQCGGRIGMDCLDSLGLVLVAHVQPPGLSATTAPASQPGAQSQAASQAATSPAELTAFTGENFRRAQVGPMQMCVPTMSLYRVPQ